MRPNTIAPATMMAATTVRAIYSPNRIFCFFGARPAGLFLPLGLFFPPGTLRLLYPGAPGWFVSLFRVHQSLVPFVLLRSQSRAFYRIGVARAGPAPPSPVCSSRTPGAPPRPDPHRPAPAGAPPPENPGLAPCSRRYRGASPAGSCRPFPVVCQKNGPRRCRRSPRTRAGPHTRPSWSGGA